ncbi:sigma-54 dependent transcriptional regulator [Methylonatrum kenyense]|uniref:sigma-54 interaction domain-containing protein n=1 Tax=Methylonatrum kenyense TaxID=455253 RepID=UPI0020BFE329|nr:sigma-54 dependent transcriptional regulator [Methylonatrum kenyense]MCK8514821.1 sigma-54 dependent transcriptional regulator [Methylonatrum kenyense]
MPRAVHGKQSEQPVARPAGILLLAPEAGLRAFLQRTLKHCNVTLGTAVTVRDARLRLQSTVPDLLVVGLGNDDAENWRLQELTAELPELPTLHILPASDKLQPDHQAAGAQRLRLPFPAQQLQRLVMQRLGASPVTVATGNLAREPDDGLVCDSSSMQAIRSLAERVAPGSTTVLLDGESGTGKEVLARFIHARSGRHGAFAPINCGALSPELLESELFGHVRGAFTGALQDREGMFSYADGGTLFLDEIGEMPADMQAKLLRVLEEQRIRPVGAEREIQVDVRIIAATNRSLGNEVASGRFREDLFYRINVLRLQLPPLRERPTDLAGLIGLFSHDLSSRLELPVRVPDDREIARLQRYHWPGNVRELKNLVERAMVLGQRLTDCLADTAVTLRNRDQGGQTGGDPSYPEDLPLAEVQRRHILRVLSAVGGNKSEAARRLQVSRKTLERKLKAWRSLGQSTV